MNGREIFATNAPEATHLHAFFRVPDGDGGWWTMGALIERDMPGVTVNDDWDALGMRATGSNSVTFGNCFVPADGAQLFAPWGRLDPGFLLVVQIVITGQVAVFLGIAEAARDWVIEYVTTRTNGPAARPVAVRPGIQRAVAEMEMQLATCRALIGSHGRFVDELMASAPDPDALTTSIGALECMKTVAGQAAVDVVDKAMQISGGAGYLTGSPLERHYRDVRAGPLMQLYSPNEALEVIGRSALGLEPWPDL